MALLRKLFYRKPPEGLLEICERVYGTVFATIFVSFVIRADCMYFWIIILYGMNWN